MQYISLHDNMQATNQASVFATTYMYVGGKASLLHVHVHMQEAFSIQQCHPHNPQFWNDFLQIQYISPAFRNVHCVPETKNP